MLESVQLELRNDNTVFGGSCLQPLCPTRWTVRTRALNALLQNYAGVIAALDEISDEPGSTGSKATGFGAKLKTFECFLGCQFQTKYSPSLNNWLRIFRMLP